MMLAHVHTRITDTVVMDAAELLLPDNSRTNSASVNVQECVADLCC